MIGENTTSTDEISQPLEPIELIEPFEQTSQQTTNNKRFIVPY
jgi:hypothetical protein